VDELQQKLLLGIGGFIAGFIVRTFIPTRKERFDIKAQQARTSRELLGERQAAYQEFSEALRALQVAKGGGERSAVEAAYWQVRRTADVYFARIDMISSYIRRGDIDPKSAAQDHIDDLVGIARKSLPEYYRVIGLVAEEYGLPKSDVLGEGTTRNLRLPMKERMSAMEHAELLRLWNLPVR